MCFESVGNEVSDYEKIQVVSGDWKGKKIAFIKKATCSQQDMMCKVYGPVMLIWNTWEKKLCWKRYWTWLFTWNNENENLIVPVNAAYSNLQENFTAGIFFLMKKKTLNI